MDRFDRIDWHLQIRAKDQDEVDRIVKHFAQKAGIRVRVLSCEGAWKVQNLFDVKLVSMVNWADPQEAIFRLLLLLREVASGWQIKGPMDYEQGRWLFGALAAAPLARFNVPGIEWANVEIRNFPLVQRDPA